MVLPVRGVNRREPDGRVNRTPQEDRPFARLIQSRITSRGSLVGAGGEGGRGKQGWMGDDHNYTLFRYQRFRNKAQGTKYLN